MKSRSRHDRRTDNLTAERIDLAVLTARAFDLHAARNYLLLTGVRFPLLQEFTSRYPAKIRPAMPMNASDRRRHRKRSGA